MSGSLPIVALHSATLAYRSKVVLEHVSMAVAPASLTAVVGDNGSGKTTLVRALAGLMPVQAGERVGYPELAYLAASVAAPPVSPQRWLAGVGVGQEGPRLLDMLGFDGPRARSARTLSFGNLRKLLLAGVLARQASLVVLDEPENGLDDRGISALEILVREAVARGAAVVVAGHHGALLGHADRLATVAGGTVTVAGSRDRQTITFEGPAHVLRTLHDEARRLGASRIDP